MCWASILTENFASLSASSSPTQPLQKDFGDIQEI